MNKLMLQTLTDVVAFDGAEHAKSLNQPAAVLQQAVQVTAGTKLMARPGFTEGEAEKQIQQLDLFTGCSLTDRRFFMAITKHV